MSSSVRPEFDRAAAKAAGYSDAEIDAFLRDDPAPDRGSAGAGLLAAPLDLIPGATKIRGAIGGALGAAGNMLHGRAPEFGAEMDAATARERANQSAADTDLPYLTAIARGASMGAVGAMKLPATAAQAAANLTRAAQTIEPAAEAAPSLIGRVLAAAGRGARTSAVGAAAGGVAGTVYGTADADGSLADRLRAGVNAAPLGAAAGAALGGVTGPTMRAAEALERGVTRATPAGRAAAAKTANMGPLTQRALRFLGEDIAAGGQNPRAMLTDYAEGRIPADAALMESGGPKVADLARDSRVLGGEGSAKIERAALAMRDDQHPRVRQALRTAFDREAPNAVDFATQLADERTAQGSPLFEQANRETGLVDNPRFYQLIKTPWGKVAWNEALSMMAQDEHPLPTTTRASMRRNSPVVAPDGQAFEPSAMPEMANEIVPDLRALHYFRMAQDNLIHHPNEFRAQLPNGSKSGTATTAQAQIQRLRAETTDILHGASPTFAEADASWAKNSKRLRAFEAGQGFAGGKKDEITSVRRDLSGDEADTYDTGALSSLETILSDVRDNRDALGRVWETDAMREKYGAALPPERMAKLTEDMQRAVNRRDLVRRVLGNSNTTDKARGAERLRSDDAGEVMQLGSALFRQSPGKLAEWVANQGMKLRAARIGRGTGNELANQLTSADPEAVLQLLLQYQEANPTAGVPSRSPETLRAIAKALGATESRRSRDR